jgi:site-specific DNA-methyltransferase (adenine-specific)
MGDTVNCYLVIANATREVPPVSVHRLPKHLQEYLKSQPIAVREEFLAPNVVYQGDARIFLTNIRPNSIALSIWSPPYFVGKSYEADSSLNEWQELLREVIRLHFPILKPGGFLAINIADILCFRDEAMPKIQAQNVRRQRSPVTREDVLRAQREHPNKNRYELAKLLRCSEQTIDRRLNGNNIRGGKYETQTRVKIVGGLVEDWAIQAGLYPYDRRIWVKDACWENSRWSTLSYRSVDEFEYVYIFWKPGFTVVDRSRLTKGEWTEWGARAVWRFASVRANDDHEAKFPVELPRRLIKLLSDKHDIVLDCFLGSGTTAIAAVRENRQFIGVEIRSDYVKLAKERIARETSAPRLLETSKKAKSRRNVY